MSDWDARTTHDAAEGPQWVSAAEAADLAGVTPGTVRYWARNGLIVSEVVSGPAGERTLVRLEEVLRHARQEGAASSSQQRGTGAGETGEVVTDLPARTSELAPILKSIPEIMAQLTAATDRAARAETKVEFLAAQLADMRRRLAEAEAETGRASVPDPALPEAWETLAQPEAAPAPPEPATYAGDSAPGTGGWPAPAAASAGVDWGAATSDPPAEPAVRPPYEDAEPGPESIDWGAGAPVDAPDETPGVPAAPSPEPEPEPEDRGRLTLEEMWARPASPERPAEPPSAPADAVDWHAPVAPGAPDEEGAPEPPPKRANATVPDEDFYGSRRRRWFRRRR